MQYISDAFEKRAKEFKKGKQQLNHLLIDEKFELRELDLSSLENYNRHDLVENLLNSLVFTPHCNIKKLIVQNLDIGRCKAYLTTLQKYEEQLKLLKPELNFKSSIREMVMPNQTYKMTEEIMCEFITRYFFNRTIDFLNVEKVCFKNCFKISGREEGLSAALLQICSNKIKEPELRYTIKHLDISESALSDSIIFERLIEAILFNRQNQLESFRIYKESFTVNIKKNLLYLV